MIDLNVGVIVPTWNGGALWPECCESLVGQVKVKIKVLVIDSSSSDGTIDYAHISRFDIKVVNSSDFNHGGTRNLAAKLLMDNVDVFVFLTQDAILASPLTIFEIIKPFSDPLVAAVCGRQLPHIDANPLAKHARFFNYPEISAIKTIDDIPRYGIKVAFVSNSFTAYRKSYFDQLGGFPDNTILSEDMHLASRMILAGYKVVYNADAIVRHSHNYTPIQEFKRYFDIGVFHANEVWIQDAFGGAGGEGARFVRSELNYLFTNAILWIPRAIFTAACKLVGYKLGKNYKFLPKHWRPKFSMYRNYWLQNNNNE